MLISLLDAFVGNLAFPALIVSAGIALLVANRDAFDVDSKPREDVDPATGAVTRNWQWKYSGDRAENARLEILHLTRVLRFSAILMISVAVSFFALNGLVGVLQWYGCTDFANRVDSDPSVALIFHHGLGIVFILIGPVLMFRLMRVVRNIIRARDTPQARKNPGWTPY